MSTIDQTIQALFTKLADRKAKVAELKEAAAKSWKTNGTFRLLGSSATTNIQTAPQEVIDEVVVHLFIMCNGSQAASAHLKRSIGFKIQGYSLNDWLADVEKRMAAINIREEEKELAALETRLNSVLSPDERRRIEVEMLMKDLG